jgi:hypothetical protein
MQQVVCFSRQTGNLNQAQTFSTELAKSRHHTGDFPSACDFVAFCLEAVGLGVVQCSDNW